MKLGIKLIPNIIEDRIMAAITKTRIEVPLSESFLLVFSIMFMFLIFVLNIKKSTKSRENITKLNPDEVDVVKPLRVYLSENITGRINDRNNQIE